MQPGVKGEVTTEVWVCVHACVHVCMCGCGLCRACVTSGGVVAGCVRVCAHAGAEGGIRNKPWVFRVSLCVHGPHGLGSEF